MSSPLLTFRLLTLSDIETLEQHFPQPTPGSHVRRLDRQAAGDYSYWCALISDTIVAIQLIRWHGPIEYEDRQISQLPELGSLYVLPDYRGKGIGSQLVRHSEQEIIAQGYTGVGAIIKDENTISIQLHIKDGYTRVGVATRTKQDPDSPRSYYIKRFTSQQR